MIKFILSCFFCFFLGFSPDCNAQVLWQIHNNKVTTWNYNEGDEFNNSFIDTSKWLDSYPWGRSLYCSLENHYYTNFKNCKLENGILSLIAKPEKITARSVPYEDDNYRLLCEGKDIGKNLRTFDYTTGMIFSKKKYHYGYYEIKFRSSAGKGIWPAFWLYAGHENDEIDVFELNGSRNTEFHVDVHCQKGCKNYKTTFGLIRKNWGDYLTASVNWESGFNVISIEWQPSFIKWFLNGKAVAYWKGNFEMPMWVIANIALARNGGPFGPGPDKTTPFPAAFDIDYIRMWTTANASTSKSSTMVQMELPDVTGGKAYLVKGSRPESKNKILNEKHTFILFTPAGANTYFVEISGTVPNELAIEVTDASGNVEYKSNDASKMIHQFIFPGNGKIKISSGDVLLEHSF